MAHLSLSFLGGFEATFDAEPITSFGADKARALLAFLAIEASRPHRRAMLSAMFWPDLPEKKAAHNLSQNLLRIRQALRENIPNTHPPFLLATPQDVQFNIHGDCQLDVTRFRELLNLCTQHHHTDATNCGVCIQWLGQAAEIYRGDLLAGLLVPDSYAFEEWRLVQQEALRQQALETLRRLAAYYEQRGEFERVGDYARRQIALEAWNEEAHLQLMRALVQSGQTSAALRQYEIHRRTLVEELGIKPSIDITKFYEQIRSKGEAGPIAVQPGEGSAIWLPSEGERRQITTLVCSHGPVGDFDEAQEQIAFCERHCKVIFNRFNGWRAPRQGGACLVYFGYPQAFEDAARRAVHSGLAVIEALKGSGNVRIGVHTGPVMVGERRGRRWQDRDLVGAGVEIARDCQSQAGPGEMLITEDTRRLVQEFFDFQARGTPAVGVARQTIQVYRVRQESHAQSRLDWLAQTQRLTAFTGREAVLARLEAIREEAFQGKGQVVLLSGEPGIGKSRLTLELKKSMPIAGALTASTPGQPPLALWFDSQCLPHYQNTSLYPVIGLLEGLLGFEASDSSDVRREKLNGMLARYRLNRPAAVWLLSLLLGLLSEAPAPETITKDQREQIRQIFIALVQKRAAEQPLVLVIEDLQWSDPSTVDWLGLSIGPFSAAPCLTVLTARPGFHPAWMPDQVIPGSQGSAARRPGMRKAKNERRANHNLHPGLLVLYLDPLGAEQAGQMLDDLAGESRLDEETRRYIITQTDGIPLFIEELTKTLLERVVFQDKTNTGSEIPTTLLDSLVARLDNLEAAKETAQWAAVLGREFYDQILQACVPYDEQRLQDDLARLIEAELVSPVHTTPQELWPDLLVVPAAKRSRRYAFKHALVLDAAYALMPKRTRQAYHRRVAEVLETRFAQIAETQPEVLAEHYANAGLRSQAVDCWLRAGKRATAQGATLEASIFFDRAIAGIEVADNERRWQALEGRETALCFRGEREAQKADIAALLELAETLADETRRAQAQIRQARYASSQADYQEQLKAADAAIDAAGRAGATTLEVEALAYKVTALMRLGERVALPHTVERILAQTQKIDDDHIRAYAFAAVALYSFEAGDLTRAVQFLTQSLEAAGNSRGRHLELESQYYGHLGFTYAQLGLYEQARQALETGLNLANLMGLGRYQAYHQINLGFVCWRMGDLNTAIQMEGQALKEYTATGERFGQAVCQAYLGCILKEAGDPTNAAKYLAKARAGFAELGVEPDAYEAQAAEARVASVQGQQEAARRLAKEVWDYLCEHGTEGLSSPAQVYICLADVLEAVEIPGIVLGEVIEAGYHDLMQRTDRISDPDWRRSFLENVAENRAILERWKRGSSYLRL